MLVFTRRRWQKVIVCPSIVVEPVWIGDGVADIHVDSWPDTVVSRVRVPCENGMYVFDPARCVPIESAFVSAHPLWSVATEDILRIGENIFVLIARIRNGFSVRLAIDAPLEVPVHRWEIFLAIEKERKEAALLVAK